MAKKSVISVSVEADVVSFNVDGAGEFSLRMGELADDIRNRAMIHGLVQKVSDAAAMPKADLPADPIEAAKAKFNAMTAVADRLREGEWSKRSGDGAGPVAGVIFRAYAEFVATKFEKAKKPVPPVEAIRAQYDAMDRAAQLGLRNVPAIATIIERMKSERGAKASAVNADELLAGLGL